MMTKDEFISLLELYGTDIARWPHGTERDAAVHLAAYRADMEADAALDAMLDSYAVAPAGDHLLERMMDAALAQEFSRIEAVKPARWHVAALAACAVMGLWCGNISLQNQGTESLSLQESFADLFGTTTLSEVAL